MNFLKNISFRHIYMTILCIYYLLFSLQSFFLLLFLSALFYLLNKTMVYTLKRNETLKHNLFQFKKFNARSYRFNSLLKITKALYCVGFICFSVVLYETININYIHLFLQKGNFGDKELLNTFFLCSVFFFSSGLISVLTGFLYLNYNVNFKTSYFFQFALCVFFLACSLPMIFALNLFLTSLLLEPSSLSNFVAIQLNGFGYETLHVRLMHESLRLAPEIYDPYLLLNENHILTEKNIRAFILKHNDFLFAKLPTLDSINLGIIGKK